MRLYFRNLDSGFVESSYVAGSEGAALLASDPDWEQIDGPDGEAIESVEVSAAAAKLAEAEGIDLETVEGTGKNGSITKADVQAAIDAEDDGGEQEDE